MTRINKGKTIRAKNKQTNKQTKNKQTNKTQNNENKARMFKCYHQV